MIRPVVRTLISSESDDRIGTEILGEIPGIRVLSYDPNSQRLTDRQRTAEILIPPYRSSHRPIRLLDQLPKLKMVQLLSAGTDEWANHVPTEVTLSSARGAHAGPVSEWVLSAVLTHLRQWPALMRFQDERTWAHRRFDADTLAGKSALIVGAGSIGLAVAERLAAFDAASTLVASTGREGVHGATELPELISGHDIVVITAPLTHATRGLVDASFLAAMGSGAMLVNAARGPIVVTDALVDELRAGRLRAALDVTDPEPLPTDHALWTCPGVLISPHSARTVPGTNRTCYEVAATQIRTFVTGVIPANARRLTNPHREAP